MEKQRKTLDKWQRLRFGRRTVTNPPEDNIPLRQEPRRAEKTERLKEITELLKGSGRSTPHTQQSTSTATVIPPPSSAPPIPPPRKPRSPSINQSQESVSSRLSKEDPNQHNFDEKKKKYSGSFEEVEEHTENRPPSPSVKRISLKPNISEPYLDNLASAARKEAAPVTPTLAQSEDDLFIAPPKVESRTVHGSYTQKSIPYRSASFSQVDHSSGKYIKSALGAIKASLKKNKEQTVVDNANLTLPRKKDACKKEPETENMPKEADEDRFIYLKGDSCDYDNYTTNELIENEEECLDTPHPQIIFEDSAPFRPDIFVVVKASEMTLDTLSEEEILIDSSSPPKEHLIQTATTCLIPVPVCECAVKETPDNWINANEDENVKEIEEYNISLEKITELAEIPEKVEEVIREQKSNPANAAYKVDDKKHKDSGYCCGDEHPTFLIGDDGLPDSTDDSPRKVLLAEPTHKNSKFERSNTWSSELEKVPSISVTAGSSNDSDEFAQFNRKKIRDIVATEFVEVRKRHSNEDRSERFTEALTSTESINSSVHSTSEDRRRIDKSKRRKGIYIQWPVIDKQKTLDPAEVWNVANSQDPNSPIINNVAPLWTCDSIEGDTTPDTDGGAILQSCDFSSFDYEKKLKSLSNPANGNLFLLCKTPEEVHTPASHHSGSFDPATPESDCNRPPIWPKPTRRLSCQSSEEKDDPTAASPAAKSFQKILPRSDSVSDNDTDVDRRERASQSPAPNDQDLKRYSKRPLRGPYGQMLEAEMKKPNKLHYDGILEELNRAER